MKRFKDANGREWDIVVNVGTAKRVRDILSVDIFNIFTSEVEKIFTDPILLVNILYVLVEKQCKDRGLSEEQFGEALVGDAIESASMAMMEEVANFFPSGRRQIAMKTIEKSAAAAKMLETKAMTILDQMDLNTINLQQPTKSLA